MRVLADVSAYVTARVGPDLVITLPEAWAGQQVAVLLLVEGRGGPNPDLAAPAIVALHHKAEPDTSPNPDGEMVPLPGVNGVLVRSRLLPTLAGLSPSEYLTDTKPSPFLNLTPAGPWPVPPVPRSLASKLAKWATAADLACSSPGCSAVLTREMYSYSLRHEGQPRCLVHQTVGTAARRAASRPATTKN